METISLQTTKNLITQQRFEAAVPAARNKNSAIYDAAAYKMADLLNHVAADIIGPATWATVVASLGSAAATPSTSLFYDTVAYVASKALLDLLPQLDIVMTATGLGVVSTNDTAPASRDRVASLTTALSQQAAYALGDIYKDCFRIQGWAASMPQLAQCCNLFFHPRFLQRFAGYDKVTEAEWNKAQPAIAQAEGKMRTALSPQLISRLVRQQTGLLPRTDNARLLADYLRRWTGQLIAADHAGAARRWKHIMAFVEENLQDFPEYHTSNAYKLQHHDNYENKEGDAAFHFVG